MYDRILVILGCLTNWASLEHAVSDQYGVAKNAGMGGLPADTLHLIIDRVV